MDTPDADPEGTAAAIDQPSRHRIAQVRPQGPAELLPRQRQSATTPAAGEPCSQRGHDPGTRTANNQPHHQNRIAPRRQPVRSPVTVEDGPEALGALLDILQRGCTRSSIVSTGGR